MIFEQVASGVGRNFSYLIGEEKTRNGYSSFYGFPPAYERRPWLCHFIFKISIGGD